MPAANMHPQASCGCYTLPDKWYILSSRRLLSLLSTDHSAGNVLPAAVGPLSQRTVRLLSIASSAGRELFDNQCIDN
jgi:hypothetical protein